VAFRIFELGNIGFGFGRLVRCKQLGFDQRIDLADRDQIELRAPGARFGDDAVEGLLTAGAKDLALDEGILFFEIIEQRLRLGHVGRRVPNQFAFLFGAFDELDLFIGLTPCRGHAQRNDQRQRDPRYKP
jgi:hypothetical protein